MRRWTVLAAQGWEDLLQLEEGSLCQVGREMISVLLYPKKSDSLSLLSRASTWALLLVLLLSCMVIRKCTRLNVPLYVIISFTYSLTYPFLKYLSKILSMLVSTTLVFVHNSSDFATFIRSCHLQPWDLLIYFDVASLFTNVPVTLVVDVAQWSLRAIISLSEHTPLNANKLAHLLEYCLNAT